MNTYKRDELWQGHMRALWVAFAVQVVAEILQQVIVGRGDKPSDIGLYEGIGFVIIGVLALTRLWAEAAARWRDHFGD